MAEGKREESSGEESSWEDTESDEGPMDFPVLEQGSEDWLEVRKKMAATASKFATALGFGFQSRSAYMKEKLGLKRPAPSNDAMQFGIEWEDYVVELYRGVMGKRNLILHRHGFRRYEYEPRIGGSPDRIVEDLDTGEKWLLEIKTTTPSKMRDDVPIYHIPQLQGLMAIYNLPFAHYVSWGDEDGLFVSEVPFNAVLWEDWYLQDIVDFCEMWEEKEIPGRMDSKKKAKLLEKTEKLCERKTPRCFLKK